MKFTKLLAASAISLCTLTNAMAEEPFSLKPYVGFDIGAMNVDYGTESGVDYSNFYADNFATISPYVGVELTDNFAVEVGYLKSNEKSKGFDAALLGDSGNADAELSFSGFYLDGVGKYDVNEKLTALGSVGIARLKADTTLTGSGGSFEGDETETSIRLGAGAEYTLTDKMNVRGMVRYMDTGFDSVDSAVQYTVGLNYAF